MIIIGTFIVSSWYADRLRERVVAEGSSGMGVRFITDTRLPAGMILQSKKALVYGDEEYERLIAEWLEEFAAEQQRMKEIAGRAAAAGVWSDKEVLANLERAMFPWRSRKVD